DDSDSIVSWGQRGFTLDLMAPGSGILATNYVGTHTSKSGTSMSTPHVAGTAALIRQYFLQKYNRTLSPKDIERLMKYSGKDIPDSATNFTYSRIDAYSAVTSKGAVSTTVGATPFYTTTANPHDSSCLSDMQAGESCNVSWMVNATGDFQNYTFFAIFETVYMSNITPKLNITITNNIPQLTSPSLNNITGNTTTVFNFTVNYSDADNHEPYFIYIVIGNSSQSMLPADVSDTNYSDGAVYYYQTTLVEGNYSYYFNASDRFNTTTTGVVYAPNVTDNTAPSLVVSSPQDNLNTSTALQSFVFNVSDESAQYLNCSLVFDNTAVISVNVSSGFSGSMNYTVSSEGMHYWNISCSDGTNVNISLTRRIAYDATAPDVTLVSPPEVAALSGNYANFTFNASDNVFSTVSCSLVVGSSVYYSNVSVANATDTTVFLSNLSAGSNSWRVNCTDSAANTANSPSRTVIVPLAN
ncbi:S8 family serine peptidase, partial [Candidatus Woesearchaeota archaeon]|nr:S8 family serine peptidase [Candidatus Woesearchaeota archaeon]